AVSWVWIASRRSYATSNDTYNGQQSAVWSFRSQGRGLSWVVWVIFSCRLLHSYHPISHEYVVLFPDVGVGPKPAVYQIYPVIDRRSVLFQDSCDVRHIVSQPVHQMRYKLGFQAYFFFHSSCHVNIL